MPMKMTTSKFSKAHVGQSSGWIAVMIQTSAYTARRTCRKRLVEKEGAGGITQAMNTEHPAALPVQSAPRTSVRDRVARPCGGGRHHSGRPGHFRRRATGDKGQPENDVKDVIRGPQNKVIRNDR